MESNTDKPSAFYSITGQSQSMLLTCTCLFWRMTATLIQTWIFQFSKNDHLNRRTTWLTRDIYFMYRMAGSRLLPARVSMHCICVRIPLFFLFSSDSVFFGQPYFPFFDTCYTWNKKSEKNAKKKLSNSHWKECEKHLPGENTEIQIDLVGLHYILNIDYTLIRDTILHHQEYNGKDTK